MTEDDSASVLELETRTSRAPKAAERYDRGGREMESVWTRPGYRGRERRERVVAIGLARGGNLHRELIRAVLTVWLLTLEGRESKSKYTTRGDTDTHRR